MQILEFFSPLFDMDTQPLFSACKFGSLSTVETLLKHYHRPENAAAFTGTIVNDEGETIVAVTMAGNHFDHLKIQYLLLSQDPDTFVKKWQPKDDLL